MVDFLTEAAAKAVVLERIQDRGDTAKADEIAFIDTLLDDSKAQTTAGATHWRPYWAAAVWLEQNIAVQQFDAADEATFSHDQPTINSLFALQRSYDLSRQLVVPVGYEPTTAECRGCASDNGQSGKGTTWTPGFSVNTRVC